MRTSNDSKPQNIRRKEKETKTPKKWYLQSVEPTSSSTCSSESCAAKARALLLIILAEASVRSESAERHDLCVSCLKLLFFRFSPQYIRVESKDAKTKSCKEEEKMECIKLATAHEPHAESIRWKVSCEKIYSSLY